MIKRSVEACQEWLMERVEEIVVAAGHAGLQYSAEEIAAMEKKILAQQIKVWPSPLAAEKMILGPSAIEEEAEEEEDSRQHPGVILTIYKVILTLPLKQLREKVILQKMKEQFPERKKMYHTVRMQCYRLRRAEILDWLDGRVNERGHYNFLNREKLERHVRMVERGEANSEIEFESFPKIPR